MPALLYTPDGKYNPKEGEKWVKQRKAEYERACKKAIAYFRKLDISHKTGSYFVEIKNGKIRTMRTFKGKILEKEDRVEDFFSPLPTPFASTDRHAMRDALDAHDKKARQLFYKWYVTGSYWINAAHTHYLRTGDTMGVDFYGTKRERKKKKGE